MSWEQWPERSLNDSAGTRPRPAPLGGVADRDGLGGGDLRRQRGWESGASGGEAQAHSGDDRDRRGA
jgi:hypothetical protein